mgnify:CR=1 FL=1|tara:strand:- start:1829 stop:2956 length:1128 start_codon:yes stop_codon:yes gene_type:complete
MDLPNYNSTINNNKCLSRKNKLLFINQQCCKNKKNEYFCTIHSKSKDILRIDEPLPKKYKKYVDFNYYFENQEKCFKKNSILELLNTCRFYKLPLPHSLNKNSKQELINKIKKIFDILKDYNQKKNLKKVIKIQLSVKKYLKKKNIKLRGPGFIDRNICNNQEDFLTFESIKEIPDKYFFSFKDDKFIYGFDIRSFNKLLDNKMNNPYNRNDIPLQAITNLNSLILNKTYNLEEDLEITKEQKMNHSIINVFQKIDQLETYAGGTDINWFLNLSKSQLRSYYKVLEDIWNYRSELGPQRKKEIVPIKKMFQMNVKSYSKLTSKSVMRTILLQEMEKLVDSAHKREDKILGSYYVLIGLVEVSLEVAGALPWLVQV